MAEFSTLRKFEALSPFEIKDELIEAGQGDLQDDAIGLPRMPAAAIPTGSPPRRAKASSCSASSPSPRASG